LVRDLPDDRELSREWKPASANESGENFTKWLTAPTSLSRYYILSNPWFALNLLNV
jgi:hypothetical protein